MIITTRHEIVDHYIVSDLGIVSAAASPSRNTLRDMLAGFRNTLGKEVKEYSEMINLARNMALKRLEEQAVKLGANAIVGIQFTSIASVSNVAQLMVTGQAVTIKKHQYPGVEQ